MKIIKLVKVVICLVMLFFMVGCGADYHFKQAQKLESQNKNKEAIERYEAISKKFPQTEFAPRARLNAANLYLNRLKDYKSAILEYEKLLSNYPNSPFAKEAQEILPTAYFEYGKKLQEQGKYEEASGKYQFLISMHPTGPLLEKAKKGLNSCQGLLKEIKSNFEQGNKFLESKKFTKAMENFQTIIELQYNAEAKEKLELAKQGKVNWLINQGDKYCSKEQFTKGINLYKKVYEIDPTNSIVTSRIRTAKAKRETTFEYIANYVIKNRGSGASAAVALGKYKGTSIKWRAKVGIICMGINRTNPPVEFKKGKLGFFGFPSHGLDKLKFLIFCERNENKWVTIKGRLTGASDWPGTPLIVEVDSISLD